MVQREYLSKASHQMGGGDDRELFSTILVPTLCYILPAVLGLAYMKFFTILGGRHEGGSNFHNLSIFLSLHT